MARKASVWLRAGTTWYYATIGGKQTRLSQDRKEAERLLHELLGKKKPVDDQPEPPSVLGPSFKKLADEYLKATRGDKIDRVFQCQVKTLQAFSDHVKRIRAAELKPHMVGAWLRTKPTWGTSTQSNQRKTIKACLNWAVREGYLAENPLKRMVGGDTVRRDLILTEDQKKRIAEVVTPDFRDFLRAIELTGCRPFSEMANLEAGMVDFAAGTATIQQHKNRKKSGKPRIIFLVPELLEMLRGRAARYPTGPLFRSRRGAKWSAVSGWKWMDAIKKRTGITAYPYAWRHGYITDALIRGVPVEVVAELVGNTPQIIYRHYSHVGKDRAAMRAAAVKAVG